jgi:hypothetical protein
MSVPLHLGNRSDVAVHVAWRVAWDVGHVRCIRGTSWGCFLGRYPYGSLSLPPHPSLFLLPHSLSLVRDVIAIATLPQININSSIIHLLRSIAVVLVVFPLIRCTNYKKW